MLELTVDEAQARLPELIRRASEGEEIVILGEAGTAVRLVAVSLPGRPRFGSARGLFTMSDDLEERLEDFAPHER